MYEELIANAIDQTKNWSEDENVLFSGLTVLSKDLAEYLATTGRTAGEAKPFLEAYSEAMDMERLYWEKNGSSLFMPLEKVGLPNGFAEAAEKGTLDMTPLGNQSIVHEWTRNPGRKLLEKFKVKFKETICGKDGPYEKLQNKLLGQADLPAAIVASILTAGTISMAAFWIPLLVYIALLLTKATLKTYCE